MLATASSLRVKLRAATKERKDLMAASMVGRSCAKRVAMASSEESEDDVVVVVMLL